MIFGHEMWDEWDHRLPGVAPTAPDTRVIGGLRSRSGSGWRARPDERAWQAVPFAARAGAGSANAQVTRFQRG